MAFTRPWYDDNPGYVGDAIAIPRVWLTLIVSILIHVALLWFLLPRIKDMLMPGPVEGDSPPISVQLAQSAPVSRAQPDASAPPPSPPPQPAPQPPRREPARRPAIIAVRPRVPTPGALQVPAPPVTPPPPAPVPTPTPPPAQKPDQVDMSAYIASQRAARGEAPASGQPAAESDSDRRNRIVAQNLAGVNSPQPFAGQPKNGGGLFEVTLQQYDYAEFKFYGWNRDIRRQAAQVYEVRKGDAPSIQMAMVRKMIAIIRESITGDFTWRSDRSGKDVQLSARPEDNAALEQYLLNDMFGAGTPAQRR